jgi:hypothetical protein
MKGLIKKLLRENLLDEVSGELYDKIKGEYSNDRIIMSKYDSITFNPDMVREQRVGPKPSGLWYGIGDSWIRWVRNEMEDWEHDNVFKININESNIVIIRTYDELIAFDAKYGVYSESRLVFESGRMIDWGKVANDYGGIEIAPYIVEARYGIDWYRGWDVASGCIWNKDTITGIDKLVIDDNLDEGFLSTKIGDRFDKFKEKWGKIKEIAHREGNETHLAATILYKFLNPKTKSSVTDDEIKFLKSQSKDILKILTVVGLGTISMFIPLALEKVLNKRGKSIMPKDNINNV